MTYEESLYHYQSCERLIDARVWATVRVTGYEFDELRSKASEVFMNACASFKPGKNTEFSTWLVWMLNGHLLNYAKKMTKECTLSEMPKEDTTDITAFHRAELHDEIEMLSEEAKTVCKIVLEGAYEAINVASDTPPKMIRGAIVRHLRENGCSRPQAWGCIREIKHMLEEL